MLKMFKNKKAQNTAEYAILIALVIGGVVAMQTYAQRALQARIHDVSSFMTTNGSTDAQGCKIGSSTQYEPYYLHSDYNVVSNSVDYKRMGDGLVGQDSQSNRSRIGVQNSSYVNTEFN